MIVPGGGGGLGVEVPEGYGTELRRIQVNMEFASIPDAIEDLKAGKMIVVVDDPDRENEGDLIMPGETCTPEAMNFMIRFGRGVPCIPTTPERLEQLNIPMMTKQNTARLGTAMG